MVTDCDFQAGKNGKYKTILKALVATGTLVSMYLAYCLFLYPVSAHIIGAHIFYLQEYPTELQQYGGILYVIATSAPPFFSSIKNTCFLAAAVFVSYLITTILYDDYLISVWCFFASLISAIVVIIMNKVNIQPSVHSEREIHLIKQHSYGRF